MKKRVLFENFEIVHYDGNRAASIVLVYHKLKHSNKYISYSLYDHPVHLTERLIEYIKS